jgi:hypothetical protein
MKGQRPNDRQSPRAWPRQPSVTEYQVKLWAKYLRTHFVTTEGLHLRRSLGKWTSDSNLEWRYAQSPTNVLFDTTLRLQAIPVRSARSTHRATTFSAWRHAPRITTFSTLATVSSLYPLTAVSRGMGAGFTANPHPYLVHGSLAASTTWPQAAVAEV